jgi:hypothetical protein
MEAGPASKITVFDPIAGIGAQKYAASCLVSSSTLASNQCLAITRGSRS